MLTLEQIHKSQYNQCKMHLNEVIQYAEWLASLLPENVVQDNAGQLEVRALEIAEIKSVYERPAQPHR